MKPKRIRLPGGKWITRTLKVSSIEAIADAREDEVWELGDGNSVLVKEMDTRHIANAIRVLEDRAKPSLRLLNMDATEENIARVAAAQYPVYLKLREELAQRVASITVTAKPPTQLELKPEEPDRHFNFEYEQ